MTNLENDKTMIYSLNIILKELKKLEKTKSFKGVYYDVHAFNQIEKVFINCIDLIKRDRDRQTEYSCENECCRKYYLSEYNNGYCSDKCRGDN